MENELQASADTLRLFLSDFEVVISESERAKINHAEQGEPDEAVVGTRPDEAGCKDRSDNEYAAHGWRSLLPAMEVGKTMNFCRGANRLSQLQCSQFSDDEISKNERDQKSCYRRGDGSERDIKENVEPNELIAQSMEVVNHVEVTNDE